MAVADMHQRKAEMARHSDAFIALPGSYNNTPYSLLNSHLYHQHYLTSFLTNYTHYHFKRKKQAILTVHTTLFTLFTLLMMLRVSFFHECEVF